MSKPLVRPPQRWRRTRRLPLSTLLAAGFGGLMLLAVGSVLALSVGGAGRNTSELLSDKADLILSSIEQRVRQHLDPVAAQALYLKELIERGQIDPDDETALGAALRAALAATPQVSGIGFIRADSRVVSVLRQDGVAQRQDWSQRAEIAEVLAASRAGHSTGWGAPVWSAPFNQTMIPFAAPVHRDGRLLGVLVPALLTSELSGYVARFSSPGQTAFVLHGPNEVLAHPRLVNGDPKGSRSRPLPPVAEIDDPVLAAIWSPERERLSLGVRPGQQGHIVPFPDDYFVYIYRSLDGYGERPWLIGAALPGREIGREAERLQKIGMIGLALLTLAVLSAIWVGRRVARPVRDLVAVADAVRRLDLASVPVLPRSRVRELDTAGQALNSLVSALRWFELYLPKQLVRRLLQQGGGEQLARAIEREVTVMFTDIGGFARLAARLSPSDTAAFLNQHFALVGGCVEAEDGTIDKYIGDSVMAFWGAPDRQADHAERACRAALGIAAALRADNAERRARGLEAVRLRIGIATGRVLVGNIGAPGRVNYTLVGDVVNVAQRLEQLGKEIDDAEEIVALITEDSHACLRDQPEARLIDRRAVRDRDGVIGIYRLA